MGGRRLPRQVSVPVTQVSSRLIKLDELLAVLTSAQADIPAAFRGAAWCAWHDRHGLEVYYHRDETPAEALTRIGVDPEPAPAAAPLSFQAWLQGTGITDDAIGELVQQLKTAAIDSDITGPTDLQHLVARLSLPPVASDLVAKLWRRFRVAKDAAIKNSGKPAWRVAMELDNEAKGVRKKTTI